LKVRGRQVLPVACCALLSISTIAIGDDDDKAADSGQPSAQPSLSSEQQHAVGIEVAHPVAAIAPQRIEALGTVLDAAALTADLGEATTAAAVEHSTTAELTRLHALYEGGAGASLKMVEAAQAEQAKAQVQAQVAAAQFAMRWSPLAAMPAAARLKVVEASASGRSVLLRADVPGRHTLGALPAKAVVDVDGVEVPARVLGILRQTTELQSAGVLIEVPAAPAGLGPGARVPVALLTAVRSGLLLPRGALLYDENGAYVYKQLAKNTAAEKTRYAAVKVKLLIPFGDGWLVDGIDHDDDIVVHGAGVLWSLQGVGGQQNDDDDD
jgi:hypothetical protein